MRVGTRIVLKPSWEAWAAQPEDLVIELDPGMAFGTGLHPSTRLCLAALEDTVAAGDHVLDVGTGSGVLAVAALKLGAAQVLATDIDPIAVAVAQENLGLNGYAAGPEGSVEVRQASVPEGVAGRFQVVVANILAEVLAGLLDGRYGNVSLAEPLAADGTLILAGIIEERAGLVEAALARHGLALCDRYQEQDWVALAARRAAQLARTA
jgi:ribosomal protein L11 methyltransferase